MTEFSRFALYYTPPAKSELAQFGANWLGWDIERAEFVDFEFASQFPDKIEELTQRPRKYGFHATIKAPFSLATKTDLSDLSATINEFSKSLKPIKINALEVTSKHDFVSLRQQIPSSELQAFAFNCVKHFEPFRAPLTQTQLAKRRASSLSRKQEIYLGQYGYPYVGDEFDFHMTLTGRLEPDLAVQVASTLQAHLENLNVLEQEITELTLCGERPDGQFETVERFPFGDLS